MSERARRGLKPESLKEIENNYKIVSSDLHMIETIGGGSARCMVAEMYWKFNKLNLINFNFLLISY